MGSEPRLEANVTRRLLPFAAIGLLSLLTPVLPPQPDDWAYVWIAFGLTFAIAASGFLVPWSRLPRWTYLLPPLSYFVVVALLRHASDGSVSGYAPLALLPVVWIALNLGRKEVAIGVVGGASVLVVPLLVGDPANYAESDWHRAVLWTAVAALVGFSVEALVRETRVQTRIARSHADAVSGHERAAISDVSRALTAETDAREQICKATCDIAEASLATIWEPDGAGALVLTSRVGPDPGRHRLMLDGEPSGTVWAFTTGESYFVADAVGAATLPQDVVERTGAVSMLFEPIVRSGIPIGVLSVGWRHRVGDVGERTAEVVKLLAIEAAVAIERADLLARLSEMADTDDLTGLPNRRTWNDTIRQAVAHAARSGTRLCVAIVDLDHFKAFNDRHGHLAGDRLLKSAAASWRAALRQTDTLARYGGEEFAVALPSCSAAEAEAVLERLRQRTPEGQTCSIGLAEWAVGESGVELLERADEALYEAKRSGRDALVVFA